MSTDDPKEQGDPERAAAKDDEDDTTGHRPARESADPDFGTRAPSRMAEADDNDDAEGHRLAR